MSGYDEMRNPWASDEYQNVRCANGIVNVDNQCVCPANGLMTPPYETPCNGAGAGPYHSPTTPLTPVAKELVGIHRPVFASNGRPFLTGTDGAAMQAPYL